MKSGNLFAPVSHGAGEFIEFLMSVAAGSVRIERIVSKGDVSPEGFWYDQDEWEWVAVLRGEAELEFESPAFCEGGRRVLSAGDWILIPAHERHRVSRTSTEPACVWLAVFGR